MAISERAPGTQSPETPHSPDAAFIASHMAGVVDNLKQDRQSIQNPYEVCRRADLAMVAMLEVVAPALPQIVQEQVNRLIAILDEFYQSAQPSPPQQKQEHEQ